MKVNSTSHIFAERDAPKREKKRDDQPKRDDSESDSSSFSRTLDAEQVGSAVDALAQDLASSDIDLNASMEGKGPGLRVTLKDGRGAIVRQFTGEEFIRLREAAQGATRGRLLDKKL